MAISTLSLSSSLTTQCKISLHHQNPPLLSLSKPLSSSSLSLSKPKLSSPLLLARPAFSHLCKFSESEGAVAEVEPEVDNSETESESGPVQTLEVSSVKKEFPKREEIFAVIMVGGHQYIVFPGRFIYTDRLKGAEVNDKIALNKVLLVGTKTSTYIGKPIVTNAVVHAVVEEQGLNKKVIVFKYKKKKNYRRKIGHRQPNTRIRITAITGYQDYPASTHESVQS